MVSRLKWLVVILTANILFACAATAEPKVTFEKEFIKIGDKKIKVEIAKTDAQHEYGLMNRAKLPDNEGMLFVFENEQTRSFWMKNTLINLSIGYFDKNRKLIDVHEMKVVSVLQTDLPSYPSKRPAQYALEMNEGWFSKNKVKEGAVLTYPLPK